MDTTVLMFKDKAKRNEVFESLRQSTEPNERKVVKWSDPMPVMLSESEFKLDQKGRVVWEDGWFVGYPSEESSWKRLQNKQRN